MKRLTSLLLVLLLTVAGSSASASDFEPFNTLEGYFVDIDDINGEVWIEYSNLPALKAYAGRWPVYATLALESYYENGRWITLLQLYIGIEKGGADIDSMVISIDNIDYSYPGIASMDTGGNYIERVLPIGAAALEMLEAMIATEGEVKVRFCTIRENHTFIMTDIQRQSIADLYHTYLNSALYDAAYLERVDSYYPLTVSSFPGLSIGGRVE